MTQETIHNSKSIDLKQSINHKLKEINTLLRDIYKYQKNVGVLEGLSGIILFQFYYAKYTNNDTYADWGLESLELLLELINEGNCITTYASGIVGASWTLEHLNKSGFIDIDNDELLTGAEPLLKAIMFKGLSEGNYDFLHGGLGYAYYFLSRYKNTQNKSLKNDYKDVLIEVINKLKDLSETDAQGVKWISEIKSQDYKVKGYNLSLSHGMSSILSILSNLYQEDVFKKHTERLLKETTNFLLSKKLSKDANSRSLFPSWIIDNSSGDINSRVAWCYGDFGIALATYKASEVLNNKLLKQESLSIFKHISKRRASYDTLVKDTGLCHGAFGNAQIFNSMYKRTNNFIFKNAATYWIEKGLKMAKFEDGYAGFKQWKGPNDWVSRESLLEGTAGIGLSMIDFMSKDRNYWDTCLLIS